MRLTWNTIRSILLANKDPMSTRELAVEYLKLAKIMGAKKDKTYLHLLDVREDVSSLVRVMTRAGELVRSKHQQSATSSVWLSKYSCSEIFLPSTLVRDAAGVLHWRIAVKPEDIPDFIYQKWPRNNTCWVGWDGFLGVDATGIIMFTFREPKGGARIPIRQTTRDDLQRRAKSALSCKALVPAV